MNQISVSKCISLAVIALKSAIDWLSWARCSELALEIRYVILSPIGKHFKKNCWKCALLDLTEIDKNFIHKKPHCSVLNVLAT